MENREIKELFLQADKQIAIQESRLSLIHI